MSALDLLQQDRSLIARLTASLTDDQMCVIPKGHKNNILWNLGHLVVVQQLLLYRLSGLEMYIPLDLVGLYKTGTSPADWAERPNIALVKTLLLDLPSRLVEDHRAGRFTDYRPYTTSTGIALPDWETALAFNHFHEGLHTGIIMSLKKHLAQSSKA